MMCGKRSDIVSNYSKKPVLRDAEFWFIFAVIAGFFFIALIGVGIEEYFHLNQTKTKGWDV